LGNRISALEGSHLELLHQFFKEKRAAIDRYMDQVWIPTLSSELMSDPKISSRWPKLGTDRDRVDFLRLIGPKIQRKINEQRQSMVEPLDELEGTIESRLSSEYDQARGINNTVTSFLESASKVEANRQRYMAMLGIHEADVEEALDGADKAIGDLAVKAESVGDAVKDAEAYKATLEGVVERAKAAFRGK
jgi:hypothetical protein